MVSEYKEEDIEFANRILHHREELPDQEVKEWLESGENCRLLDEMAGLKRMLHPQDYADLKEAEWLRLKRVLVVRQMNRRNWWLSIAAVLVVTLGTGWWFSLQKSEVEVSEKPGTVSGIFPGQIRAELVCADGKNIPLTAQQVRIDMPGLSGVVNDSVNGLDYSEVAVSDEEIGRVYNTLKVPVGGFYKLELSDGTKVWLNAASELKFPVQFGGAKREVYLKGEGYFEVAKDKISQFIVHLKNSAVTVLGTKFNISAYENEAHIYTTLCKGSVRFFCELNQQQFNLRPGTQSVMNVTTGHTTLSEVDPSVYTSWVDGRFVFHSLKLEAIMRQLQRWYDFEVFYQTPEVKDYTFRGAVNRDVNIERVLKMIERTTDVHFSIKGQTVTVSKKD